MGCLMNKKTKKRIATREQGIDEMIRKDQEIMDKESKLLLLGPGESGKSTILKQIQVIHKKKFDDPEERKKYRLVVFDNVVHSIQSLVTASTRFNNEITNVSESEIEEICNLENDVKYFTKEQANLIQKIWESESIQETYLQRNKFHLFDSAKFFLDNIERITEQDYIPTVKDIIQSRSRTTGIFDVDFNYGDIKFRLSDVGGQRNERRKWIHCFQGVTAVLFVVSLNEYDEKLFEDSNVSRMEESLLLFDEICNSRWFIDTPIILLLNKNDLFEEKIKTKDLNVCFEDYGGGCDYDNALKFIREKFLSLNLRSKTKEIHVREMCATDTDNIDDVFETIKEIVSTDQKKNISNL
ncbi:guanine nucleotide-binding protein g(o) subunit alpha [Anaeramoeba flamelloides]|uniref:Guanine nucleotide-binding protein g(O) subunit alpha n=1 Tax=Anaeramoeba flamelloides TaxID=1746091 RepID=A0AAV7YH07_9EUKA|nr:guanine nucleotide-binding protein g(o) subunit alpha [Anaeramoeba flamelloides]